MPSTEKKQKSSEKMSFNSLEKKIELIQSELDQYKLQDFLLQKRLKIEKLIASISTAFISLSTESIDEGIISALKQIIEASGIDRCCLIQFSDDRKSMTSTHEAVATGIPSSKESIQNIPILRYDWGLHELDKHDFLTINSDSKIPQKAIGERMLIENFGVKSLLSIGMKYKQSLIGFIGFDSLKEKKIWTDEEIFLFKILGQIFASALVRKRSELALKESEQKFRALTETASSAIFIYQETKFLYVNPGAESLTGYSSKELLSKNFWDIVHPEFQQIIKNRGLARQRGEPVPNRYEFKIITKSGSEKWVDFTSGLINYQGKAAALGTAFDINERKLYESAIIRNEEKLNDLFDNANDVIYTHDLTGKFTSINKAGERIIGYNQTEALQMNIKSIVAPKWLSFAKEMTEKKLSGEPSTIYELEIISKSGKFITIELSTRLIYENGKPIGVQGIGRDVTDRKKAEQEIAKWRKRYELISEASNQVVFEFDIEKNKTIWGGNLEKVLGYHSEEIGGSIEGWIDHIHPDDRKETQDIFDEARKTFSPHLAEYRFRRKDKSYIWLQDSGFTILDKETNRTIILGVLQDITDRKQNELKLKKSEMRYRTLFERNLSGVYRSTVEGKLLDCNESFYRMLGFESKEEFLNTSTDTVYSKSKVREKFIAELKKARMLTNYEIELVKKDGTKIWALENVSLLNSETYGEVIEGTIIDISVRKKVEDALAAEKERLTITLSSIGDGVIATDIEGKILICNKIAENLLGMNSEDIKGQLIQNIYKLFHFETKQPIDDPINNILKSPNVIYKSSGNILIDAFGTEKVIEDCATPIRDRQSKLTGVVLVFRDITEKIKMEEELLKSRKMESIGILAGGIAHDFNNILTAILGNISLTKVKIESEAKEKIVQRLTEAEKATLRAKDLTQQLLTFSKGGTPIKKIMSVSNLLRDSASFVLTGSNVRCNFEIDPNLWFSDIDEGQIAQVISNLVINAQQAMPNGGVVTVQANNFFSKSPANGKRPLPPGKFIEIKICDTGIGIPQESINKIFDPYFTTKQKGNGLGLATSYSIIKQHHGIIYVDSIIGKETVFTVYLPASEIQNDSIKQKSDSLLPGKGRILVMDDELMIRELSVNILEHLGFSVETAADGAEAIEKYKSAIKSGELFSVVIMDLTIPGGMGGKEAMTHLLQINPAVKVIVSSGYSNDPIMSDYRSYGFSGVVSKPYRIEELISEINKMIEQKPAIN